MVTTVATAQSLKSIFNLIITSYLLQLHQPRLFLNRINGLIK